MTLTKVSKMAECLIIEDEVSCNRLSVVENRKFSKTIQVNKRIWLYFVCTTDINIYCGTVNNKFISRIDFSVAVSKKQRRRDTVTLA